MKTAFIADIHGNYEALKAVLSEVDRFGISRVYCAGDIVGYYSQVNECCKELRSRGIPSVMGNHDWYMAGDGFCSRSRSVNDCLAYQRRVIENENLEWLKSLPVQIRIDKIQMVHGGWADPIDEYLKQRGNISKEWPAMSLFPDILTFKLSKGLANRPTATRGPSASPEMETRELLLQSTTARISSCIGSNTTCRRFLI